MTRCAGRSDRLGAVETGTGGGYTFAHQADYAKPLVRICPGFRRIGKLTRPPEPQSKLLEMAMEGYEIPKEITSQRRFSLLCPFSPQHRRNRLEKNPEIQPQRP